MCGRIKIDGSVVLHFFWMYGHPNILPRLGLEWMYLNISIRFKSYRQIPRISYEQDSDENLGD